MSVRAACTFRLTALKRFNQATLSVMPMSPESHAPRAVCRFRLTALKRFNQATLSVMPMSEFLAQARQNSNSMGADLGLGETQSLGADRDGEAGQGAKWSDSAHILVRWGTCAASGLR